MNNRFTFPALAVATLLGCLAASQPALARAAAPDSDQVSIRVSYADLNLDSRAGAEALLRRVGQAAESVCGSRPSDHLDDLMIYRACVRSVADRAVANLGHPLVSALNVGERIETHAVVEASNR
jgi:UrcA family protein